MPALAAALAFPSRTSEGAFKTVRMSSNNRSYSGKGHSMPPAGEGSMGLKRGASQFVLCHWQRDAERRRWRQRRRMACRVSVAPRGKELFSSLANRGPPERAHRLLSAPLFSRLRWAVFAQSSFGEPKEQRLPAQSGDKGSRGVDGLPPGLADVPTKHTKEQREQRFVATC
ncbi:hypothetical protein HPB50_024952 [Hyalomma asiaticum]|uniref:Uncharacterized protein n=1 Tax=Hyalomma asiaticum TaxID=266040 RepID=A0ACB7TN98_HYAAI|nr:hypothetical protein HPB50_024952 [Hyalomma asiaticum]